jgi:hypothetical protein
MKNSYHEIRQFIFCSISKLKVRNIIVPRNFFSTHFQYTPDSSCAQSVKRERKEIDRFVLFHKSRIPKV